MGSRIDWHWIGNGLAWKERRWLLGEWLMRKGEQKKKARNITYDSNIPGHKFTTNNLMIYLLIRSRASSRLSQLITIFAFFRLNKEGLLSIPYISCIITKSFIIKGVCIVPKNVTTHYSNITLAKAILSHCLNIHLCYFDISKTLSKKEGYSDFIKSIISSIYLSICSLNK